MQPTWLWAPMTLAICAGAAAAADPPPMDMIITAAEADVRCQPSDKAYATSKLHRGDQVRVIRKVDGPWLAIEPPRGSFSWISDSAITLTGQSAVVKTDTQVRVGSSVTNQPPDVWQVTLQPGTQVIILGSSMTASDGAKWWPIRHPASELRFIPDSAVAAIPAVVTTTIGPPNTSGPAPAAVPTHPLWAQAEQAERAGNFREAIRCYEELNQKATDHDLAIRAANRAHCLREGNHGSVPPNYERGKSSDVYSGSSNPQALLSSRATPPRPTTAYAPVVTQPQPSNYAPKPAVAPTGNWHGPGYLRRAAFLLYTQPTYAFEDPRGNLLLYVIAAPGVSLDPYLNRPVQLFGTVRYEGEVRKECITVTHVSPLPLR